MPTDATKCSYCGGYHTTGTTCIKGWFAIAPPDEASVLRDKIAKLRAMCAEHIYVLDVREVLAILDEVNNAAI